MDVTDSASDLVERSASVLAMRAARTLCVVATMVFLGSGATSAQVRGKPGDGVLSFEGLSEPTIERVRSAGLEDLARRGPRAALVLLTDRLPPDDRGADLAIAEMALLAAEAEPSLSVAERTALFLGAAQRSLALAAAEVAPFADDRPSLSSMPVAAKTYNRAVVGALGLVQGSPQRARMSEAVGVAFSYDLEWSWPAGFRWRQTEFEYRDAAAFKGRDLPGLARRFGIGAPVVAVRRAEALSDVTPEGGLFPTYEWFYPLTVVVEFDHLGGERGRAVFRVLDTLTSNTGTLGGRRVPFSTAYGAQPRALLSEVDHGGGRGGLVRPGRHVDEIGLFMPEPFDPLKIPVVLVHGLQSTAVTWYDVVTVLRNDDQIRSRYQFWLFQYPSGLPFPAAGAMLRQSLADALAWLDPVGSNPHLQDVVLVGHSMGGLLVRLQITSTGPALWDALFTSRPEDMILTAAHAELARTIYALEATSAVGRAVLLATPHRGSRMSGGFFGWLASWISWIPRELRQVGKQVLGQGEEHLTPEAGRRRRLPDSIEAMSPEDPVLRALAELPVDERIPFHTIIGDRGTGLGPESSDGVVEYESSHLAGAESEKIVPFGHNVHRHPVAIAELRRILLLH